MFSDLDSLIMQVSRKMFKKLKFTISTIVLSIFQKRIISLLAASCLTKCRSLSQNSIVHWYVFVSIYNEKSTNLFFMNGLSTQYTWYVLFDSGIYEAALKKNHKKLYLLYRSGERTQ